MAKDPPVEDSFRCRECLNYHRQRNNLLRDEVFNTYGGYICKCCGETNKWFLQIDHIKNDGAIHRQNIKCGLGSGFYEWLKKNNFPPGYQVLCSNCNFAKGKYGICPHKWEDKEAELPPRAIRSGRTGRRKWLD